MSTVKRFRYWVVVLVAGAGICLSAVYVRYSGQSTSALVRDIAGRYDACVATMANRAAWMGCWQPTLERAISRYGLTAVLTAIGHKYNQRDYAELGGITRCHDLTHLSGQIAIRASGDAAAVFRQCTDLCGYGCYMGVVDGSVTEDFFSKPYADLCKTSPAPLPCIHGLGHAIGNRFGNVASGQQYCMVLPDPVDQQHCITGLMMERFEASVFGHEPEPIPADLPAYCASLLEGSRNVCYWRIGFLTYLRDGNLPETIRACDAIPAFERGGCISVVGQEMYFQFRGDAQKIVELCSLYAHPDDEMTCIEGALRKSVFSDDLYRHGSEICARTEPDIRDRCYRYLQEPH